MDWFRRGEKQGDRKCKHEWVHFKGKVMTQKDPHTMMYGTHLLTVCEKCWQTYDEVSAALDEAEVLRLAQHRPDLLIHDNEEYLVFTLARRSSPVPKQLTRIVVCSESAECLPDC